MYALILAGGKGERLRPLTDTVPKPMVPVAGKPILLRQVEWLKKAGVTDVIFLVSYRWQVVQDYFGDGNAFGIRAHYSVEDTPLGRGGAIRQGLAMVPEEADTVFALNGDVITSLPPHDLVRQFRQRRESTTSHLATIMTVPMVSPYGIVDIDQDGTVQGFREKIELPYWINGGVYVLGRDILPYLPELGDHETETFPALAQEGRLSAIKSEFFWRSVDSFKDLREAEEFLTGDGGRGSTLPSDYDG